MVASTLERHAQTVLVVILGAILLWVGSTVQTTAVSVAQLQVQVATLQIEVRRPDGKFGEIERRLDLIERGLQEIKNHEHK